MKKIAIIAGVLVVLLVVIGAVHNKSVQNSEMAANDNSSQAPAQTFTKDSSIDSIAASFDADADADASKASSESQDDQSLETDLNNYNDMQTYDYQNSVQ